MYYAIVCTSHGPLLGPEHEFHYRAAAEYYWEERMKASAGAIEDFRVVSVRTGKVDHAQIRQSMIAEFIRTRCRLSPLVPAEEMAHSVLDATADLNGAEIEVALAEARDMEFRLWGSTPSQQEAAVVPVIIEKQK